MPRPKGSKNKAKKEPTEFEIEQAEAEEDVLDASASEDVDDEDSDEADDRPPAGMTRMSDLQVGASNGGSNSELLTAIREQTAALVANAPPRKVLISQFKPQSSFNPTGRKRKLKVVVYQNGYRANPTSLTDAEFDILNGNGVKPGLYLAKIVTVRVEKASSPEDQDKIHISYNNKTPDQRMMNKDHWNGFEDLLRKIVAESAARTLRLKARRQREAVQ